MNIFVPNEMSSGSADTTRVLVNVFAGSQRSRVEMRVDEFGEWSAMSKTDRPDPLYARLKTREQRASGQQARVQLLQALNDVAALFRRSREPKAAEILRLIEVIKSQPETELTSRPLSQGIIDSPHIWETCLPPGLMPGTHLLEVRTTDMFGQTYHGRRIIRIIE